MFPPDLGQFSWHLPQNLKKLSGGSAGGVDLLDGHLMWLELRAAKVATSDRWVCANALATGETFSEALGCFVLSAKLVFGLPYIFQRSQLDLSPIQQCQV